MTDQTDTAQNSAETAADEKPRRPGFQPGQSGNPGGRPKGLAKVAENARAKTDAMLGVLEEVATDKRAPPAARVAAANSILDRGWGKPSQPIGGADDLPPLGAGAMKQLTTAELEAIAAMAVAQGDAPAE